MSDKKRFVNPMIELILIGDMDILTISNLDAWSPYV